MSSSPRCQGQRRPAVEGWAVLPDVSRVALLLPPPTHLAALPGSALLRGLPEPVGKSWLRNCKQELAPYNYPIYGQEPAHKNLGVCMGLGWWVSGLLAGSWERKWFYEGRGAWRGGAQNSLAPGSMRGAQGGWAVGGTDAPSSTCCPFLGSPSHSLGAVFPLDR